MLILFYLEFSKLFENPEIFLKLLKLNMLKIIIVFIELIFLSNHLCVYIFSNQISDFSNLKIVLFSWKMGFLNLGSNPRIIKQSSDLYQKLFAN